MLAFLLGVNSRTKERVYTESNARRASDKTIVIEVDGKIKFESTALALYGCSIKYDSSTSISFLLLAAGHGTGRWSSDSLDCKKDGKDGLTEHRYAAIKSRWRD